LQSARTSFVVAAALLALAPVSATALAPAPLQDAFPDAALVPSVPQPATPAKRSIDAHGDLIALGVPADTSVGPNPGTVALFERGDDLTWSEVALLTPSTPTSAVGSSVALDEDRLLSGALELQTASVFERQPDGSWIEAGLLQPPATTPTAEFGAYCDIDGDRAVVLSLDDSSSGVDAGTLWIFEREAGGTWALADSVPLLDGNGLAFLAKGVVLSGDRAFVSAQEIHLPPLFSYPGAIQVYRRQSTGAWQRTGQISAPTVGEAFASTGFDFDGTHLAVTATLSVGGRIYILRDDAIAGFTLVDTITAAPVGTLVRKLGRSMRLGGGRLVTLTASFSGVELYEREPDGDDYELVAELAVPVGAQATDVVLTQAGDLAGVLVSSATWDESPVLAYTAGTLLHGTPELSLAAGGAHDLLLRGGESGAGAAYLVVGSATGAAPAVPLGGGVTIGIVPDAYTDLTLALAAPISGAAGVLGPNGAANATFALPAGFAPALAGTALFHAYLAIDTTTFQVAASNTVRLDLVP